MFIGPEKLAEMFGKGSKTGLAVINSPVNRCVGCPFAGRCTPCKPQTAIKAEGSILKLSSLMATEKIITTPSIASFGSFPFQSIRGEAIHTVATEKTCSQCGKNPNTCHCERNLKAA